MEYWQARAGEERNAAIVAANYRHLLGCDKPHTIGRSKGERRKICTAVIEEESRIEKSVKVKPGRFHSWEKQRWIPKRVIAE